MILLRRPTNKIPADYRVDAVKIMRLLAGKDYEVSAQDAYEAWKEYSDVYAASWLIVPDDADEVLRSVLPYLEEY